MNAKRLFYNWLQKENCLKQFKYNLKHYFPVRNTVNNESSDPYFFIFLAFRWDETDEGYLYWLLKDNAWITFLKDKYPYLIK